MGMFNSIHADLVCPVEGQIGRDTEIQIKWQKLQARLLTVYHLGDLLEDLDAEFNNQWVRTEYICALLQSLPLVYEGGGEEGGGVNA